MKTRMLLVPVFPLLLLACAAVELPQLTIDHPAHPDAAAAHLSPFSNTLALHKPSMSAVAVSTDASSAMGHDHGADEGGQAMPESENKVTLYTCPMDPEVVQDKPGKCPICGMRLKPKLEEAETDEKGDGHDRDH